MKLTDAVIKNINHQDKDQFFSMQGTEGLTLVVYKYPSKSKTWFYQYRPRGKNPVRLKVGTYEELGITKAVSRAKKISNEIFSGKDPYAARQSFKGENTLGEQIKESYKTRTIILENDQKTLDSRHLDRNDNQSSKFLKGRITKISNICNYFNDIQIKTLNNILI